MITGAKKVRIGVDDQERAKAFWLDKIGAELARDDTYGDERWLEVQLPDGLLLVLEKRTDEPPKAADGQPNTPIFLACDDLNSTHLALRERGVHFVQEPVELPFGLWSLFQDDEGNRFALQPRTD